MTVAEKEKGGHLARGSNRIMQGIAAMIAGTVGLLQGARTEVTATAVGVAKEERG